MKHTLLAFALMLILSSLDGYAQSYDKMWNTLKGYQDKDLPASVVKQAQTIYAKAQKEKNCPQMIKSYLTIMQYKEIISPDSMKNDVVSLEKWADETEKVENKAILYSILGSILKDREPEKAMRYVSYSMKNPSALAAISASDYKVIVDNGKMSEKYFKNNLLQLIANNNLRTIKSIDNLSVEVRQILPGNIVTVEDFEKFPLSLRNGKDYSTEYLMIYQTLLSEYRKIGYKDAWIITASDVANILKEYSKSYDDSNAVRNLEQIIDKNENNESVAYTYSLLIEKKYEAEEYVQALSLIKKCVSRYPKYLGINDIHNMEKDIKKPSLTVSVDEMFANVDGQIKISYRNLSAFKAKLLKLDDAITVLQLYNKGASNMYKRGKQILSKEHSLKQYSDYKYHDTLVGIKITDPGVYYMQIEAMNGVKDSALIYATSLKPMMHPLPGNKIEVVVVDALRGKPVSGAELNIYARDNNSRKYHFQRSYSADSNGIILLDANNAGKRFNITTPNDKAMKIEILNSRSYRNYTDYKKEKVSVFTDRSIYKPKDIVNFSGLAYTQNDDSTKVLASKEYEVSLLDANHTVISTMNVTTDKHGAFNGRFTLPSNCLNGRFYIKVISCMASFMVEDYKKPTFQVIFSPIEDTFKNGDTVTVKGNASSFFGLPISNGKVKYKISRGNWLNILYKLGKESIGEGETVTDKDGNFRISVPISIENKKPQRYWYGRYEISVNVTDGAGESVKAETFVPVGTTSLMINVKGLDDVVMKNDSESITYNVTNLSGAEISVPVDVKIFRVENDGKDSVLVAQQSEMSNKKLSAGWIMNLSSSKYRIVVSAKDESGRQAKYSKEFVLFSEKDKRLPVRKDFWTYFKNDVLSFGTSKSDVDIYCIIVSKDKVLYRKIYTITDSIVHFDCSYKKEYGDGVDLRLSFVKDGKFYTYEKKIIKPYPQKKLVLHWETFRNKLHPGDNEEWKLKITYPDGRPADAQLMSTMYDASLDAIYKHNWNFNINYTRDVYSYPWNTLFARKYFMSLPFKVDYLKPCQINYSSFNLPYVYGEFSYMQRPIGGMKFLASRAMNDKAMFSVKAAYAPAVMNTMETEESAAIENGDDVEMRQDFSETAFFYPQLNTDKNGIVNISFILPESLTKWHFIGLAHTGNVDYGMIESDITVSKEFMVRPSLPRFLRAGDRCKIPVSITNLQSKDSKGNIIFEMIDPLSNKVVYSSTQKFDVDKDSTYTYQLEYDVPQNYSLLSCRIIGKGKNFSDGELNYIPVLSNKEMVTESVSMFMPDKGRYSFKVPSGNAIKTVLEVTANPIWHVVQALPQMSVPSNDAVYSWASSFYASCINEYLIEKNPGIRQYASAYNAAPVSASKDMLMSELQKNQDLKEIMLSETPWVIQANNEEEQRKMLSQLVDVNWVGYNKQMAVNHLVELQNSDGSWSWYKNMPGNMYTTIDVLEALVRIKKMTGKELDYNVNNMCQSAFSYLKLKADEYYKQINDKKNYVPSEWIIRYVYISTLDNKFEYDKKVNNYFIDRIKANPSALDIYGKSLSAVAMLRMGMRKEADEFLKSLMEYTVYAKDMGRYFDTRKARCTYSLNIIPSVVSTIEALDEAGYDATYVKEMKQWLIAMKGMQSWNNNIAATNAIYALLNKENITLDGQQSGFMKINAGSENFNISQSEPLGYVKKNIANNSKTVNVDKSYSGLSYGAIYRQSLQNVDSISSKSTGIVVEKRLYKGDNMISANSVLNVGDVVRVELKVKMPAYMDFIQIKDALFACMQPVNQLSSVAWGNGLSYNREVKNASVNFFIDRLGKGEHTISYDVFITKKGIFHSGLTVVESAYFPMMRSFTSLSPLNVE